MDHRFNGVNKLTVWTNREFTNELLPRTTNYFRNHWQIFMELALTVILFLYLYFSTIDNTKMLEVCTKVEKTLNHQQGKLVECNNEKNAK
jgi:hypothetical protein